MFPALTMEHLDIKRRGRPSGRFPVAGKIQGNVEPPFGDIGIESYGLERDLEFRRPAVAVDLIADVPNDVPFDRCSYGLSDIRPSTMAPAGFVEKK